MIVVYMEMWPGGDQSKAYPLGSLGIHNVTQPGDLLDNYVYEIDEAANPALNVPELKRASTVVGHNRKQSAWKLVKRALDHCFPSIVT